MDATLYRDDISYARGRLEGTYLLTTTGRSVLVHHVGGESDVGVMHLSSGVGATMSLQDLSLDPVPMGYMNDSRARSCFYLFRFPSRSSRQGLTRNNIGWYETEGDPRLEEANLSRVFEKVYPSFTEAQAMLTTGFTRVAFNPSFALSHGEVFYKGKIVGSRTSRGISLLSNRSYLEEKLTQAIG